MGKLTIVCDKKNKTLKKLSKSVYKRLEQKDNLSCELVYVSEEEIQRLNRENRNIDKVTDVLSFPSLDGVRGKILDKKDYPYVVEGGKIFIGSIAICVKRAEEQAEEYGHSVEREMTYLTLHGILHLMGYDHLTDEDKKQMRTEEKAILKDLGIEEE